MRFRDAAGLLLVLLAACGSSAAGPSDAGDDSAASTSDGGNAIDSALTDAGDAGTFPHPDASEAPAEPRRLIVLYTPHGTIGSAWRSSPTGTGVTTPDGTKHTEWTLGTILEPFADLQDRLTMVEGLTTEPLPRVDDYAQCAYLTTGGPLVPIGDPSDGDWGAATDSLDIRVAQATAGETMFGAIGLGIEPWRTPLSGLRFSADPPHFLPVISDPSLALSEYFGGESVAPAPAAALVDAAVDSVDAWQTSRDFEHAVDAQLAITHALVATDRSRAVTIQLGRGVHNTIYRWLGHGSGYHVLSHAPVGTPDHADYLEAQRWWAARIASFVRALRDTPTPDGRDLLAHTIVLWVSDYGDSPAHSRDDMPVLIAGNVGDELDTGTLLVTEDRLYTDILLTLAQRFDPDIETLGDPAHPPAVIDAILAP